MRAQDETPRRRGRPGQRPARRGARTRAGPAARRSRASSGGRSGNSRCSRAMMGVGANGIRGEAGPTKYPVASRAGAGSRSPGRARTATAAARGPQPRAADLVARQSSLTACSGAAAGSAAGRVTTDSLLSSASPQSTDAEGRERPHRPARRPSIHADRPSVARLVTSTSGRHEIHVTAFDPPGEAMPRSNAAATAATRACGPTANRRARDAADGQGCQARGAPGGSRAAADAAPPDHRSSASSETMASGRFGRRDVAHGEDGAGKVGAERCWSGRRMATKKKSSATIVAADDGQHRQ